MHIVQSKYAEVIMATTQRQDQIMNILLDEGYVSVERLSKRVHISESSVRRDLAALEKKGLVIRSYGGAEPTNTDAVNMSFESRMLLNQQKKKQIAQVAITLLKNGNVILLNGGSTVQLLAQLLPSIKGIMVITNGIEALYFLSRNNVRVISTGGVVSMDNKNSLVGGKAVAFLKDIKSDFAFISTQRVDSDGNVYSSCENEIDTNMAMLDAAQTRVLLCDSSKIGKMSTFKLCTLRDFDIVICDKDLSAKYKKKFPGVTFFHP